MTVQVDDATTALQNAYDSLEDKPVVVDKTALQEAIAKANDLDSGKYTEDSFKDVLDALAKANEVNESADTTQEDVDLAAQNLNEAIKNLVEAPVTPETKTITVNYKTTDGAVIKTKTMTGEEGSSVTITPDAKVVDDAGLGWKTSDKAQTVKYGEVDSVDFTYDKDMVTVLLQQVSGNIILGQATINGQIGTMEDVAFEETVVHDGLYYALDDNATVTVKFGETKAVSVKYVAKQATITVKHVFNEGKDPVEETVKAQVGSSQTFNAKTFDGYTLDGSATQTITVVGNATITFNYTKNAPIVDKTALQTLYNKVKDLTQGNYTNDTWSTFTTARANALTVLNDNKATQQQVDSAKTSLQTAYNGLKENIQKIAVTVVHKDAEGNTLETEPVVEVEKGQSFTAQAKTFEGYTLNGEASQTITVTKNETITFTYTKDEAPSEPTIAEAEAKITQDLFNAINDYRVSNGCEVAVENSYAMQATATRAVEIFTVYDHTRPDGSSWGTAMDELGFIGIPSGENIGLLNGGDLNRLMELGANAALQAWKDSHDHNVFMLSSSVVQMGVGIHIEPTGNNMYKMGFVLIGVEYDMTGTSGRSSSARSLTPTTEPTVESTEQADQPTVSTEVLEQTTESTTAEVSESTTEQTTSEPTVDSEQADQPTTETVETTEQTTDETTASSEAVEVVPVSGNIGNYNQLFATEGEADAKGLAEATLEGGKWFGSTYKVVKVEMTDGTTQYGLQFTAY
ncbi:MucBP domain-containing protein [Enterococcus sp. AD013-P3]|uniref:MucBP domain-containing protein n=1 Tax=Enterococcus sp. AD013-P3 TaxID=3411036 RepID=UPI003B94FE9C